MLTAGDAGVPDEACTQCGHPLSWHVLAGRGPGREGPVGEGIPDEPWPDLTTSARGFDSEVPIDAGEGSGLKRRSAAQCQQVRAVSVGRIERVVGNVGTVALAQIREVLGLILDIPG